MPWFALFRKLEAGRTNQHRLDETAIAASRMCRSMAGSGLSHRSTYAGILDKLDAIAKWISTFKPFDSWNADALERLDLL